MQTVWQPKFDLTRPPGTWVQIMGHPSGRDKAIEVAVVDQHRFAFYYWLKWTSRLAERKEISIGRPPHLVSLDWHQDLATPSEPERGDLDHLDTENLDEVALFSWGRLNPLNDGHILAAAYLNLIGDVHITCKQDFSSVEKFSDKFRNVHSVNGYKTIDEMMQHLGREDAESLYFDIDLDYFTESEDPCGGGPDVTLVSKDEIRRIVEPSGKLMDWILPRMCGMTAALEHEFCGGIRNSNQILGVVEKTLFRPPLFSDNCGWRHLQESKTKKTWDRRISSHGN